MVVVVLIEVVDDALEEVVDNALEEVVDVIPAVVSATTVIFIQGISKRWASGCVKMR